ncbi:hypothetical protein FOXG_05908 [Fusarium oxysporum f. sp. lycopersici 4287]|uniref:Uncharacterized protein n=1 Tax=Fusarium oxysporum f. sp. lycopersici (strain 4287 / CBS 123668 / FGSC 9935 / NRRL 34936) TaxID=426428 RepID=A0A0J9UV98_FUSO4|nr:hypothetical protein FOXG_05908 [Fusarium oxysporum f. sp. lycopersici 4287]KNB03394.1 hypothetical protein FOXG_05908 [Fusarium oxysporum f. sp. lycopersici 4287]
MMTSAIRPSSQVSISGSGTATMAASQLQPLTYDGGELRIVLVPTSDDGNDASEHDIGGSEVDRRFSSDSYRSYRAPNQSIPTHPIPSLQDAFAESLDEVTSETEGPGKPKLRELDAQGRRGRLLEQAAEDEPFDTLWRYRPGQQQHEMYKLISQITFGVYLLLNSLAADNGQVVTILQGHIDEVDEFLEVMLEDFAQAHKDLTERIALLQLPMANRQAFENMLEDRTFRAKILAGNERIDHILARTNAAMKQWDDDIDAGLRSSEAFMEWLNEHKNIKWPESEPDLDSIYRAMKGNADGWLNTFDDLNNQAQDLNGLVIKLMTIVAEMEKTAGEVSRKTWATIPPFTIPVDEPKSEEPAQVDSPSTRSNTKSLTPVASIRSGESHRASHMTQDDPEVKCPAAGDLAWGWTEEVLVPPTNEEKLRTIFINGIPEGLGGDEGILRLLGACGKLHKWDSEASVTEDHKGVKFGFSDANSGFDDGPLYILQPKVYTPKSAAAPVAPGPETPRFEETSQRRTITPSTIHIPAPEEVEEQTHRRTLTQTVQDAMGLQKRTSLRQRVSLKKNPPESIHIPPRTYAEPPPSRPSPSNTAPRTARSHAPDYTLGSDLEVQQPHRLPRAISHADFSSTQSHVPVMPSPHSEHHQFYHNTIPVRASPHSPLQQRPHTAGPADVQYRPSGYFQGHQRNQPSRMGGMSTLSSVTTATYDDAATVTSRATTQAGGKRVKKKKSAFGWLKKAFSLDEDEKADYEARKAMQYQNQYNNQYYEGHSPKFLDGKRIR